MVLCHLFGYERLEIFNILKILCKSFGSYLAKTNYLYEYRGKMKKPVRESLMRAYNVLQMKWSNHFSDVIYNLGTLCKIEFPKEIVENIVKVTIFILYLLGVSQMKDIQRVFEYHGAEHKSIFCYESGEELTVENVKKHTRFHPRCGTSFLLFVIIISIIVFSLLPRFENILANISIRLLLMPLVAGISYEIIKFAGKGKNKCVMLLNKPGMWLQRFTTREPDDSQIEVAIEALKLAVGEKKAEAK
mgnify:CR=1 FL=1